MGLASKVWELLHELTTKNIVEIKSNNLEADHKSLDRALRVRKVRGYVNVGKDKDRGTLVLSKNTKH